MSKKSFILYNDSISIIKKLSDEQAGKLLKIIFDFNNGIEILEITDIAIDIVFTQIKNQFDRDNENYQKIIERNKLNGLSGGRPKNKKPKRTKTNPEEPKKPTGLIGNPEEPKKPDNDNVNVIDNKNEIVIDNVIVNEKIFCDYVKSKISHSDFLEIEKSLKLKFKSWLENGWKDGNDQKISNWKSKILNNIQFLNKEKSSAKKETNLQKELPTGKEIIEDTGWGDKFVGKIILPTKTTN